MDNEGCFTLFLILFAMAITAICTIGACFNYNHEETAVIKSVELHDGKYEYHTPELNFVSDSLYQVGDTIVITVKRQHK